MKPMVRLAKPGEEAAIHHAHMRSIREVCVKDHGDEEIRVWGNRPLGNRWVEAIRQEQVLVVDQDDKIGGMGFIRFVEENGSKVGKLDCLYLIPELIGKGLGAALMTRMLERADLEGAKKVELTSSLTAQDFYRTFGFKDTGPMTKTEVGDSLVRGIPMALDLSLRNRTMKQNPNVTLE